MQLASTLSKSTVHGLKIARGFEKLSARQIAFFTVSLHHSSDEKNYGNAVRRGNPGGCGRGGRFR